ncbi:hypothetical protein D3C84_1024400 [compost metagenome]
MATVNSDAMASRPGCASSKLTMPTLVARALARSRARIRSYSPMRIDRIDVEICRRRYSAVAPEQMMMSTSSRPSSSLPVASRWVTEVSTISSCARLA